MRWQPGFGAEDCRIKGAGSDYRAVTDDRI